MNGSEFPDHQTEPSGRIAIASRLTAIQAPCSPTSCRQSEVKSPRNWKSTAAPSAQTIDREITDQAIDFIKRKASAEQPFFAYLPYTQTHEPVDPHPDYNGKTGNGSFADVLAQTDAYVGELLDTIDEAGS